VKRIAEWLKEAECEQDSYNAHELRTLMSAYSAYTLTDFNRRVDELLHDGKELRDAYVQAFVEVAAVARDREP
jgi:hypothetical protein